jgi:hypothetical protein
MAIKDFIFRSQSRGPRGSNVNELAESLVDDIVGNNNGGVVWRGAQAGAVWLLSKLLPAFILVGIKDSGRPAYLRVPNSRHQRRIKSQNGVLTPCFHRITS